MEKSDQPGRSAERLGLGIDFGGTGIKAALIDLGTGELVGSRVRVSTPRPSTPDAVGAAVASIVKTIARDTRYRTGYRSASDCPASSRTAWS